MEWNGIHVLGMRNEEGRDEPVMRHARGEHKCTQGFVKKGSEEKAYTT